MTQKEQKSEKKLKRPEMFVSRFFFPSLPFQIESVLNKFKFEKKTKKKKTEKKKVGNWVLIGNGNEFDGI